MQIPDTPVSLADLSAAGVRLRADEAATLVRELALQVERGDVAGVPSAHVIRLSSSGVISVEGPVAAGGRSVERAAQLLDALLAQAAGDGQGRVPGGLKLVLARGLGTLDLPPFASLGQFAAAVTRFGVSDPAAMVTRLVVCWAEAVASRPEANGTRDAVAHHAHGAQIERFTPPDASTRAASAPVALTISDIRRARRATGFTLAQVSERSGIPIGLLRQLEWGYLVNWPTGPQSRMHLVRYARAAGLDDQLVVATVTPLLEQAGSLRPLLATRAAPVEVRQPELLLRSSRVVIAAAPVAPRAAGTRRSRALAMLAIPALLALALIPAWWSINTERLAPAVLSTSADLVTDDVERAPRGTAPRGSHALEAPAAAERAPAALAKPSGRSAEPPPSGWTPPDDFEPAAVDTSTVPAATTAAALGDPFPAAADGGAPSPLPASVGTAMFYEPGDDPAVPEASLGIRGAAHLKVTKIVDDAANNFHVRPSPDGRRIAFDSDRDGERGVYVSDARGENLRRVSPPGFAAMPSWAPDGRTLAFARADWDRQDVWSLWTLDLDSGSLRQVTNHEQGFPWGVSWFPDGDRLAYTVDERLVIRDLRGGTDQVFRSPRRGRLLRTPVVSPDGRLVVFRVARNGAWLLDLADGSMRRVLEDPSADEYVWSPDGRQIAYYSARVGGWSVWKMAPR